MRTPSTTSIAVILAAGAGTRLGADQSGVPKPLTPLLGVPLLDRALRSVHLAGVQRAIVVVGYRGDLVAAHARATGTSLGLDVTVIHNRQWIIGNGSSLLAAEPYVSDRCVVLMTDHLTPPSFIHLLTEDTEDTASLLVVDPHPDAIHDIDEATKVRLNGARITAIGRQVEPFDAVDTGVFLFDRRIFELLRAEIALGHGELSAAVQRLADDGLMRAIPSDGSFWCDIDTPEDLAVARRTLEREMHREIVASRNRGTVAGT